MLTSKITFLIYAVDWLKVHLWRSDAQHTQAQRDHFQLSKVALLSEDEKEEKLDPLLWHYR